MSADAFSPGEYLTLRNHVLDVNNQWWRDILKFEEVKKAANANVPAVPVPTAAVAGIVPAGGICQE